MTTLADRVHVERRFQRSIRLEADVDQLSPLEGYVLQPTAQTAMATTLQLLSSGQGAFTWTGPYGGGKSSLALTLAGLFSSDGSVAAQARSVLGQTPGLEALSASKAGEWLPVVATGRRSDPVIVLREALEAAILRAPGKARRRRPKAYDSAGRDVLERIQREVDARPEGGVVLLVDEMGKLLEAVADDGGDLHIFQDLAELANRAEGRLLIVGILHQGFERYAQSLGARAQEDWAKIQGRFVDVPLVAAADEVIDLVGQAVQSDLEQPESVSTLSTEVAAAIRRRRKGVPDDLATRLGACWPLHPVSAALLGPISRRRFGQNERSVFGLLTSAEPAGFSEFLAQTSVDSTETFDPASLWDYLRVNLEPAILASPDGHRWATAAEIVDRSRQLDSLLHERVAKTVCLIDLFANGSGIAAEQPLIEACFPSEKDAVGQALQDLVDASVLIFRRHLDSYAVHAGSDFDIDQAIGDRLTARETLDVDALNRLARIRPILAKAHHHRTGTPRWFAASMVPLDGERVPPATWHVPEDAATAVSAG
jgi:energy-coupling factor transporter ATP-binding protein EcfA2